MNVKVAELVQAQGGIVLSRKEAKERGEHVFSYTRLTLRAFDGNGTIHKSELEPFYACEDLENALFTEPGDVVLRLVSPLHPVYITADYENILVPSQFAILRVKDCRTIMPEYLRLCLAQKSVQERILDLESGTAQKTVKIKTVLDLEIPLQPLPVQQKAVQLDRLNRKRESIYRALIENERMATEHLIEKLMGGTNA